MFRALFSGRWHSVLSLPLILGRRVVALWKRDFNDVRLILEHEGDVHYVQLTPRFQRIATRAAISGGAALSCIVVALQVNSWRLSSRVTELETSQRNISSALAIVENQPLVTPAEARAVAARVKRRQDELLHLVATLSESLSEENAQLWRELQLAGVDRDLLESLRQARPAGGPATRPQLSAIADSAIPARLADNLDLKEALRSLPGELPLTRAQVSSTYGLRRHPVLGGLDSHDGLDLTSAIGDDTIRVVREGRVRIARPSGGYGNMVTVVHPGGVETLYGHMARILVREGQVVDARTPLGIVGATGLATGKHLHYEVRLDGKTLNPDIIIRATRYVQ